MKSKKITQTLFAIYILALIWIVLFKMSFSIHDLPHIRNINLIPFADSVIINGKLDTREIINNIAAFIPFGIFMKMLSNRKSFSPHIAPVFFFSLTIEILQYIFSIGATDITDLLANTAGGAIGIGIFAILEKVFRENARKIMNLICIIGGGGLIMLILLLIAANI